MKKYSIILVVSILTVISIKTILADIPEIFPYGQALGEIFYELGLAISFTTALYLYQLDRYRRKLKKKFDNKTFEGFLEESPKVPVHIIELSVDDNVIQFCGKLIKNNDPFDGELIMNPITLKVGDGFQYHTDSKSEGFGFMRVIIREDNSSFLIESPYTQMKEGTTIGTTVQQAFIWRLKKE